MAIKIPTRLQNENYRFCLIKPKTKKPFEDDWPNKGYKYNDKKLLEWLENGGNYGVIGGGGDLRIIDIDDEKLGKKILEKLNSFAVSTGGGGIHIYIECEYDKNHVFAKKLGELRGKNYMVVGPNSIHPSGKEYTITNDIEIKKIRVEELLKIITPILKEISEISGEQIEKDEAYINKNILKKINKFTRSLITERRTKGQLKELGFPSRSERDYNVINSLLTNGFGQYIKSIFELYPVGDKYKEHSNKKKYLEYSIKKSREFTGVQDDYIIKLEIEIDELDSRFLKNKVDYYLNKILEIGDWMKRLQLLNLIAYKIKIKSYILEKRLEELYDSKRERLEMNGIELLEKKYPEPEYWIHPIIPKGALIIFGGRPDSFKSMLTLSISIALVCDKKFLNKFEVNNPVPKILYYDLENGPHIQYHRIKYLIKGGELDKKGISNIKFSFDFNRNNIKKEMEISKDYDIIILDSYRRFLEGAEDKSEITNKFFNTYLYKLREMGKTVIIIHHFRKQKIEEMETGDVLDAFRGSGDITAQLDIVYGVFKSEEAASLNNKQLFFNVSVMKAKVRNIYPIQNFTFKVMRDDENKFTKYSFMGFGKIQSPKERRETDIVKLIESKGEMGLEEIIKIITNSYICKEVTIKKDMENLIKSGRLKSPFHGRYRKGDIE